MVLTFLTRPLGLTRTKSARKPWLLKYRSSKPFIILTIALAVFTDVFLYAVIVPVIPFALNSRTGINEDHVQSWVSVLVAVYGGALAISSPICGWFADASPNRRIPLLLGLAALAGATVMLNLGRQIALLIVGRALQGVSAAVVWCVGLALLSDTVATHEIGEMMGYVFVAMSLGILAGPLLGGLVLAKAGYNVVFGMCYVLVGVDIAMRFMMIEKKVALQWEPTTSQIEPTQQKKILEHADNETVHEPPTDEAKQTTDEIQTTEGVVAAPKAGNENSPSNVGTPESMVGQSNSPKKRTPAMLTLVKSRRLLSALWSCMVVSSLMTQFDSVLPLYVKEIFGWGSIGSGLIFLPFVLPSFFSPVIGGLIDKFGPRWFAVAGFILFSPFEIMLRLVDHNSIGQKVLLCALLVLMGISLNLSMPPMMVEITYVIEQKERGCPGLFGKRGAYAQAYGLFNMAWAAGSLVGPLWAGFVKEKAGWGTMSWSMAILSFVTALPVAIWTGGSIFSKVKRGRPNQTPIEMGVQTAANV